MSEIITLICYWNGRVVVSRKGVSYDGPPPPATLIRAGVSYEEFIDKIYHMTGYRKEYERLEVTCRYPVKKEYIALPITDQETLDIAFAVVTPPGNSLESYTSIVERIALHTTMRNRLGQASPHPVQRPITMKEECSYSLSMNRFRQSMSIRGH